MCERLVIDGHPVIICGLRRQKTKACEFCGKSSTKQCDYPVGPGKTCDSYMCDACSVPLADNLDHCVGHSRVGKTYSVVSGRHAGHEMKILAWRKVRARPGVQTMVWKYAAQCSCMAAGDMEPAQLLFALTAHMEAVS